MSGLLDKVVLVSGAARGTGRVHCARFAEEGADVIALDGTAAADDLDQTVALIEQRGRRGVRAFADVRDGASMLAAIDAAVGQLGRLDVIIANAGIHPPPAPTWELTEEAWRNTLDVNLTGVWHTITPGVAHMGADGRLGGDHQFHQWVARHREHRALHREQACARGSGANARQ